MLDQQQTIRELRAEIEKLKDASEREGKRQAAPFRRKKGYEGQSRAVSTEIARYVEVPLEVCPHCKGTDIEKQRPIKQYVEELPPQEVESVHPLGDQRRERGCLGAGLRRKKTSPSPFCRR